jgi:hypothetical protein
VLCGFPTMQGTGPDQLHARRVKNQLTRNETNSRPRHTGEDKAAGDCRLGPQSMRYAPFVQRIAQSLQ